MENLENKRLNNDYYFINNISLLEIENKIKNNLGSNNFFLPTTNEESLNFDNPNENLKKSLISADSILDEMVNFEKINLQKNLINENANYNINNNLDYSDQISPFHDKYVKKENNIIIDCIKKFPNNQFFDNSKKLENFNILLKNKNNNNYATYDLNHSKKNILRFLKFILLLNE